MLLASITNALSVDVTTLPLISYTVALLPNLAKVLAENSSAPSIVSVAPEPDVVIVEDAYLHDHPYFQVFPGIFRNPPC